MVPCSVEDERVFSAMNFIKSRLRNRLTVHLSEAVRLFRCNRTLRDFDFAAALEHWRKQGRYGMGGGLHKAIAITSDSESDSDYE
jgi:hypothetical protein